MLLNDVGSRHIDRGGVHMLTGPADVRMREVVSRSLAHPTAPSPVSAMFESIQRPPAVMNYNFGQLHTFVNVQVNKYHSEN